MMANLLLAYVILKLFYRDQFSKSITVEIVEHIRDYRLAFLSKLSLIIALPVLAEIVTILLRLDIEFRLTYIALIPGTLNPSIRRRMDILRKMDWYTLIFLAAMFILMESV